MIIDGSYFSGILSLGINWETGADSITRRAETNNLQSYIDLYERKYLSLVLGEDMSREFIDYLSSEGSNIGKWDSLKDKLSIKGYSPVANYVFFQYVRRCGIKITQTGAVYAGGEDKANPNPILIPAWNDMVGMNYALLDYLRSDNVYAGFTFNKRMLETINQFGI